MIYISTDSIFIKTVQNTFSVKGTCRASMKKEFRKMNVTLNKKTGKVIKAHCTCPAGNSGYCNHVMALLFELAGYSLHQLKVVPEEVACTSKLRQWGVASEKFKYPKPVMNTSIQKQTTAMHAQIQTMITFMLFISLNQLCVQNLVIFQ